MKVVTSAQMRELDSLAINEKRIPGLNLMEAAGRGVAMSIEARFPVKDFPGVLFICGKGNNGGDGFVAARYLAEDGYIPIVALIGKIQDVNPESDAGVNLSRWIEKGGDLRELEGVESIDILTELLDDADFIVDAMLGTGLKGSVRGFAEEVIKAIYEVEKPVVSVDTPSGLDCDTGTVSGEAVRAHLTVTMALPKLGHMFFPGRSYVGDLEVIDIGIPDSLVERSDSEIYATDRKMVAESLPARAPDSHKGDSGKVMIIGGSPGFTGAPVLAARAAVKSGTGLVHVAVPFSLNPILEMKLTEAMTFPVGDPDGEGIFGGESALEACLDFAGGMDAIAIGPGLGTAEKTVEFVLDFLKRTEVSCIVDADGLNCLATDTSVIRGKNAVLTPHPGEMARLTGKSIGTIVDSPMKAARELANELGVIVVLKGAPTVTALPDGRIFINTTGNPGMASGGSGDVLTGLIAGFVAMRMSMEEAAIAAVYIHGLAGDIAFEKLSIHMSATDLITNIPEAAGYTFIDQNIEGLPELLIDQDWLHSPFIERM